MNTKRKFYVPFIPTNLTNIPVDPNYVSGFIEGDGSLIVESTGLLRKKKGRLSISLDQKNTNKPLIESFKPLLNIKSSLVNTKNNVLKLKKFGDKYFKTTLIPFFLNYPFHGNKLLVLYKIIWILNIKDSSKPQKDKLKEIKNIAA